MITWLHVAAVASATAFVSGELPARWARVVRIASRHNSRSVAVAIAVLSINYLLVVFVGFDLKAKGA